VYVPYQNYGTGVGLEYPVDFVENYVGINNMLDYLAADNHIQGASGGGNGFSISTVTVRRSLARAISTSSEMLRHPRPHARQQTAAVIYPPAQPTYKIFNL
jgi:hypothetical protein